MVSITTANDSPDNSDNSDNFSIDSSNGLSDDPMDEPVSRHSETTAPSNTQELVKLVKVLFCYPSHQALT